jgi:EpsI family protein
MKNLRLIIAILILLIAIAVNQYISLPEIAFPRKDLKGFPADIEGWTLISDQKIDEKSMRILNVDDYIMRNYRNADGRVIGLYIGYFKSQKEGKGIHSPRQCLPGAGWNPIHNQIYHIQLFKSYPKKVPVNKFVMEKGLERQLYLFWYEGRGRVYASEYWNKIYLIWDSIWKKRTDGALIRVNISIGEDPEKAFEEQYKFIQSFYPFLSEYIPD